MPLLLLALAVALGALHLKKPADAAIVKMATWNILGAHHTDSPKGSKFRTRWLKSAARVAIVILVMRATPRDVWALQECQPSQRRAIQRALGWKYACHYSVDNVIFYGRRRWKLHASGFITTPYFDGKPRQMPWVVLIGRRAGNLAAFLCTHDPAHADAAGWRRVCRIRAAEWANNMRERFPSIDGIFDLGDKNAGGSYINHVKKLGARAAGKASIWGIDWIVQWHDLAQWRGFRTATSRRASDHPIVLAYAAI